MNKEGNTCESLVANIFHDISNPITSVMVLNDYEGGNATDMAEVKRIKNMATKGLSSTLQIYYAAYSGKLPAFSFRDMLSDYLSYSSIKILDLRCHNVLVEEMQAVTRLVIMISKKLKNACSLSITINEDRAITCQVLINRNHNTRDNVKLITTELSCAGHQCNLHTSLWRDVSYNIYITQDDNEVLIAFKAKSSAGLGNRLDS